MKYKKVIIEWEDITFFNGHTKINKIDDLVMETYQTIGFLIKKNKKYVTLALTLRMDNCGFTDVYVGRVL